MIALILTIIGCLIIFVPTDKLTLFESLVTGILIMILGALMQIGWEITERRNDQ